MTSLRISGVIVGTRLSIISWRGLGLDLEAFSLSLSRNIEDSLQVTSSVSVGFEEKEDVSDTTGAANAGDIGSPRFSFS
jgi:hypothetical protein